MTHRSNRKNFPPAKSEREYQADIDLLKEELKALHDSVSDYFLNQVAVDQELSFDYNSIVPSKIGNALSRACMTLDRFYK